MATRLDKCAPGKKAWVKVGGDVSLRESCQKVGMGRKAGA
jgi:hypothetical protein